MNYTASDLLGVSAGFLLFSLFAFAPGYTFGWLSNVFEFRQRRLATRIAGAVPLSIGLTPISAYFLWRWSLPLVWIVFGASGVICAVLLVRDARVLKLNLTRAGRLVAVIAAAWLVIGTFSLVDLQIGNRLYFPFSTHDLGTHTAFAAALARDGIPPHNPFFFAGRPAPLRYHYFWYIPCALVHLLGGSLVSARLAVIAGILWVGLGLFGIITLYLRFFQEKGGEQIERRTLIGVSLLGITGLDILPVLMLDLILKEILPSIEWWNTAVASWINTVLWAPHDLASMIAGLAGFLLTWDAALHHQRRRRIVGLLAGSMAFASAAGASIYVGGTLAAACAVWTGIALLRRRWRHALALTVAGALAMLLLTPFILQVMAGGKAPGAAAHSAFPFSFMVRAFSIPDILARSAKPITLQLLNAALLPLNYFFEFGFFFVAGCLVVRRMVRRGLRTDTEWAAAVLASTSLLICSFVSSTVIANNDLGFRGMLLVQFILLLWAAEMWNEGILGFRRARTSQPSVQRALAPRLVALTLTLGALGSCYELCMQRIFPVLEDTASVQIYPWLSSDRRLGRRNFELRRAYQEINRILPENDVVQGEPDSDLGNLPAEMYSGRQMVADGGSCGTTFGGSEKFCNDVILPHLKPLFADGALVTFSEAEHACSEFSISALLFKDTDPVWKDKSSWIWSAQPLISNDFVRVIACGASEEAKTGYTQQAKAEKSK